MRGWRGSSCRVPCDPVPFGKEFELPVAAADVDESEDVHEGFSLLFSIMIVLKFLFLRVFSGKESHIICFSVAYCS